MKTLINTCPADPWIKVAKQLENEKIIEPVYWIGYYHDNSEKDVPATFPGIIYHSRWDSWKAIFPDEIEKIYTDYPLDTDFLKEIAGYELQAMTMMDRMDPDRHCFPFAERQRLFRNVLRKWLACIDLYGIELIIADRIPHRSYDYPLYLICKHSGIKYLYLYPTDPATLRRSIICSDIKRLEAGFIQDYIDYCNQNEGVNTEAIKNKFSNDLISLYDKIKDKKDIQPPYYIKMYKKRQRQNATVLQVGLNFLLEFFNVKKNKEIHLRRNKSILSDFLDVHPYSKKPNKLIEESKYNALEYGWATYKAIRYKRKLKSFYNSMAVRPDYSIPYVYFPLHYQPEATSCPAGDIFVDQYLAIEQLAAILPKDWRVYVKEHVTQFHTISEGQKARFKHLYTDLMKIKNVCLVSIDVSSFELTDNAKAVATLTGTAGWEAIVRGKPVIIFGLSWYEGCHGVLKIRSHGDFKKINEFISNFQPDEKAILNYILAIQKNGILFRSAMKDRHDEEQYVKHIALIIKDAL